MFFLLEFYIQVIEGQRAELAEKDRIIAELRKQVEDRDKINELQN